MGDGAILLVVIIVVREVVVARSRARWRRELDWEPSGRAHRSCVCWTESRIRGGAIKYVKEGERADEESAWAVEEEEDGDGEGGGGGAAKGEGRRPPMTTRVSGRATARGASGRAVAAPCGGAAVRRCGKS